MQLARTWCGRCGVEDRVGVGVGSRRGWGSVLGEMVADKEMVTAGDTSDRGRGGRGRVGLDSGRRRKEDARSGCLAAAGAGHAESGAGTVGGGRRLRTETVAGGQVKWYAQVEVCGAKMQRQRGRFKMR